MDLLATLSKIASKLDQLGYTDDADDLDLIIQTASVSLRRVAAHKYSLVVKIIEDESQNQWLATIDVVRDGQLEIGNFDSVSSPIYQTPEAKAAGDKNPGIQQMRQVLRRDLIDLRRRNPAYAHAQIVIQDPRFR